jgi:carbonic anhydrase
MTPHIATPMGAAPASPHRRGPAEALADLLAGNRRFAGGRPIHGHDVGSAAAQSGGQQPYATVVGCIDSRVPLEAVFDQNFGSICVVRSGAHVLDQAVIGSVEFAVSQLSVPLVMVLGHERCGAVAATVEALRTGRYPSGSLGYLVEQIAPAVREAGIDHPNVHSRALRKHVERTVARLSGVQRLLEASREDTDAQHRIKIVGAVYDLDTGVVEML